MEHRAQSSHQPAQRCGSCRFFVDDSAALEQALPGILALSSAMGDTRGEQGLCEVHSQMLYPHMRCRLFAPRQG